MRTALLLASMSACGQPMAQPRAVDFDDVAQRTGTGAFQREGSSWQGGRIESEAIPGLFASGDRHYEVSAEGARVEFSPPARELRFFYAHGFGVAPGTARAFDANGASLGTRDSRAADVFAAPQGFVQFDGAVARVEFEGGAVDHVTWKTDDTAGFTLGTRINGTWLIADPAPYIAGQGFAIEYLPETQQLFVAWFTWSGDTPTRPRWLVANGSANADGGDLTIYAPQGGQFNAPADLQQPAIGTLRLRFTACDAGTAEFSIPGEQRSGTIPIRAARALLAGSVCD